MVVIRVEEVFLFIIIQKEVNLLNKNNMELVDVIKKRKSIRTFQKVDVSNEVLEELIALARKSPSAGAIRGYKAIITREKVTRIDAPVYVVICTDTELYAKKYGERGKTLYAIQDATIFGSYFQLLLVNQGLDSCWVGAFKEEKIKKILNLEKNLRPIIIIVLGYK